MDRLLKLIFLDFDGVIVESVGIKDQAFEMLYADHPEHLDHIMRYHLTHNATIRFEKFKYIAENILHTPYSSAEEKRLSDTFSALVRQKIIECPFVEGAIEFLKTFESKIPLYLVTMSPRDELDRVLEARNLKVYFKKVYAFPLKKTEAFREILSVEGCPVENTVYIGDTPEDYQAARETQIPFVGRKSKKSFGDTSIPVFNNMTEIQSHLIHTYTIERSSSLLMGDDYDRLPI